MSDSASTAPGPHDAPPSGGVGDARPRLSVVIITLNEERNILAALASTEWADERIVVDACSTDRTTDIAREQGAIVHVRPWPGFAEQRNWALQQARGDWILPLDADEIVPAGLAQEILEVIASDPAVNGYWIPRQNYFFGRWIRRGGLWPDPKLRLFRRGTGSFLNLPVHEGLQVTGPTATLRHALVHNTHPTLEGYVATMNRYSSLAAIQRGPRGFSLFNIVLRPLATFFYNYFLRLGFLDGKEGLLVHLYHACYVSWTYAKAWERTRGK